MKRNSMIIRKLIYSAMCTALCVILPIFFHMIPNLGSAFSPIHIPVLICGLMCGWKCGLACGFSGVLLSAVITQMPPMAMLPPMLIECMVYGAVAGVMMKFVKIGQPYIKILTSLSTAMIIGRIVAGVFKALIFSRGEITIAIWVTSYFVAVFPAIILHLILIPVIVLALQKAGLSPEI